jgi:peptidoglycan/LPS O-acetylase OafA/YrhL
MEKIEEKSGNKLDYVDALRGIAILGVIMVHANPYEEVGGVLRNVIKDGTMGVQLFFMASAFTLFLSFKNRQGKEKTPIKNFFIRRFFRIAPMYYLGIIYYLFQDGFGARYWLGDATHISVFNIISNITFLHGFNPYWINSLVPGGWSIAVEMTFYAILPFLFLKIKNLNQAFNFFTISVIIRFIFHIALYKLHVIGSELLWYWYLFFYFPSQLPIFSLGIMMYFIILEKEKITCISGKSLLIFSLLLLSQLLTGTEIFLPNHILFGIGFLIFGIAISRYKSKIFVNPIITYIGRISFSMYLVHFAVLYWMEKLNFINFVSGEVLNFTIRFFIVILVTAVISTVSYKWIEIPFQNMGRKVIKKL